MTATGLCNNVASSRAADEARPHTARANGAALNCLLPEAALPEKAGGRGKRAKCCAVPRPAAVPASTEAWALEILRIWSQGPANTLDLARLLGQARGSLPHGGWTRLWTTERIPFSKRKAEMLVVVGRNLEELDAQSVARLPASWTTLYYLAELGHELVELLIGQGRIHPRLTRAQARALLVEFKPEAAQKPAPSPLDRRFSCFVKFVRAAIPAWPVGERQLRRTQLLALAEELHASINPISQFPRN